jgi:hypothetical protein
VAGTLACFRKQTVWGRHHLPQPTETTVARREGRTTESEEEETVVSFKQNGIRNNILTVEAFDKPHEL